MSKEAKRVIQQVQANNLQNIVSRVRVNNLREFISCFDKIRAACPNTVMMIVADKPITKKQKDKILFVGANVPERARETIPGWLLDSTKYATGGFTTEHSTINGPNIHEIHFPEDSEQSPFKLVDVVVSTAFNCLRKAGLIVDESSSEEDYGGFEL